MTAGHGHILALWMGSYIGTGYWDGFTRVIAGKDGKRLGGLYGQVAVASKVYLCSTEPDSQYSRDWTVSQRFSSAMRMSQQLKSPPRESRFVTLTMPAPVSVLGKQARDGGTDESRPARQNVRGARRTLGHARANLQTFLRISRESICII